MFFPIVKEGKLEDFKKVWSEWFVLTDLLEDEKRPGLLKEEFLSQDGSIVALCPKNYQVYCRKKGMLFSFYLTKKIKNYFRSNKGGEERYPVSIQTGT